MVNFTATAPFSAPSDIHPASRVSARLHDPALIEMLQVPVGEPLIDYVVDCVVATVQFAMDKSWGSCSDPMSLKQPAFVCFVRSVLKLSRCPASTIFVALVYLDKARMQMRISRGDWACERAFLGALMLANKYVNDTHYSYQAWAEASCVFNKRDVIRLERELLAVLQFQLSVHSHDITAHHTAVMTRCQPRRLSLPPTPPLYSYHALGQSCNPSTLSACSPTGSSSSSEGSWSSTSPYDSPTLLTPDTWSANPAPGCHADWAQDRADSHPLPYLLSDECTDVWSSLPTARTKWLTHDPLFPQYADAPAQKILGDAPDLTLRGFEDAYKGFDAHPVTLPHLSEVLPYALTHPQLADGLTYPLDHLAVCTAPQEPAAPMFSRGFASVPHPYADVPMENVW